MRSSVISVLAATFAGVVLADQTMTSATFDLDTAPVTTVHAPCAIGYSPLWIEGVDSAGASVAIYAVAHVGTERPVTTLVYRAAIDAKGVYSYTPDEGGPDAVRLVMALEKDGAVLGTLAHDVAFGTYAELSGVSADTREVSLQEVADTTGIVPFVYDTAWMEGAALVRVDWVNRTREKYGPVVTTTNEVAKLSEAGVRNWAVPNEDGFDRLVMRFFDTEGVEIGEPLESRWLEKYVPRGMILMLR